MRRNRLVIMLKEPVAGRVKTRLGRDIGMTNAAWWFRHQTADLIQRMSRDPRWETLLSVAPDTSLNSRAWPHDVRQLPQGTGNLGTRMRRIFETTPNGPTLIVGGDIPGIKSHHIRDAFIKLGNKEMVFGPATDGGFWLVGAKRGASALPPRLFKNVRWSSAETLSDTLISAGNASIAFAQTLQDVDTAADLRHL